jgi:uncharacterized membrane protein
VSGPVTRRDVVAAGGCALAAAGCVAAAVPGLRVVAGLSLCLLFPGHLATLALAPGAGDLGRRTRLVVAVALSVVATMAVGLVAAASVGVGSGPVALGLGAACLALTLVGLVRADRRRPPARSRPWPVRRLVILLPLVLAAAAFAAVALRAAGGPSAAGFTELAVEPHGNGLVAVATSHEHATIGFRYQVRVAGRTARTGAMALQPGERRELTLPAPRGRRLEVLLYAPGRPGPYRRVDVQPPPARGGGRAGG